MTRVQFLNDLYHHLYGLTQEQAEQHLTYYAEMLADRMEEGMSEADAVASMEDVETIARRIMEGEGLPYTPPDQRPVTPPAYPDASRLGGGGGTRAYQAPKRKNWKKFAQIALWAVAIIAAAGAIGRWRANRDVPVHNYRTDTTAEYTATSPALAPYAEEYWGSGEAPLAEGFGYPSGETCIDPSDVDGIEIEWAAGMVWIGSWGGDDIRVIEYSQNEPSERTQMELSVAGKTLDIRYRKGGGLINVKGQKWLEILIPDGMMWKIDVSTASADVQVNGTELDTLRIGTASGDVNANLCYTQTTEIQTVSGNVMCGEVYAGQMTVTTTSGEIYGDVHSSKLEAASTSGDIQINNLNETEELDLNTISGDIYANMMDSTPQKIDVGTVSGDVQLSLPYDMGCTLNYSTVSGEINVSAMEFDIRGKNGSYTYNGGGYELNISTTSGNVEIY